MNPNNQKLRKLLSTLRVLETLYLLISIALIFSRNIPHEAFQAFLQDWVWSSYFILPLLLFKNIIVAVFNNGILTQNQKIWLVVRCALFVFLSIFSYPLVLAL